MSIWIQIIHLCWGAYKDGYAYRRMILIPLFLFSKLLIMNASFKSLTIHYFILALVTTKNEIIWKHNRKPREHYKQSIILYHTFAPKAHQEFTLLVLIIFLINIINITSSILSFGVLLDHSQNKNMLRKFLTKAILKKIVINTIVSDTWSIYWVSCEEWSWAKLSTNNQGEYLNLMKIMSNTNQKTLLCLRRFLLVTRSII